MRKLFLVALVVTILLVYHSTMVSAGRDKKDKAESNTPSKDEGDKDKTGSNKSSREEDDKQKGGSNKSSDERGDREKGGSNKSSKQEDDKQKGGSNKSSDERGDRDKGGSNKSSKEDDGKDKGGSNKSSKEEDDKQKGGSNKSSGERGDREKGGSNKSSKTEDDKEKGGSNKSSKDKGDREKGGSNKASKEDEGGKEKGGSNKASSKSDKEKGGSNKSSKDAGDKEKSGSNKASNKGDKEKGGSNKSSKEEDDKQKGGSNKSSKDKGDREKGGSNKASKEDEGDKEKGGSNKASSRSDKEKGGSNKSSKDAGDKEKSGSNKASNKGDREKGGSNKASNKSDKEKSGSNKSSKGREDKDKTLSVLIPEESGTKCIDMDLESIGNKFFSSKIGGCKKVKAISANTVKSLAKCELGKSFGFDGNKVFATAGCRGNFRVCYEQEEEAALEAQATGKLACKKPFQEAFGRCLDIERNTRKKQDDATERCAKAGGRLVSLTSEELEAASGTLGQMDIFKGKKFWLGAVKNIAKFALSKTAMNIATRFSIRSSDVGKCVRRFSVDATVEDKNHRSSLSDKCLAFDFDDDNGPTVVDCDERLGYICEQVDEDVQAAGRWTAWINSNENDRRGDEEDFRTISRAILRGKLNLEALRLCKKPIGMQCREVGTQKLYTKAETHGLKLDRACERDSIQCRNSKQNRGTSCPDFEVRFLCPDEEANDCSVDDIRKACERRNRKCVNTPFGTKCVRERRQRTGRERIGESTCSMNSLTYTVHECSAEGDPHYLTPDGKKYDMQGDCGYNFATTCNNFVPTEDFPEFSVIVYNHRENEQDKVTVTKAAVFKIAGIKYHFTRGKFYVGGRERTVVDYSDDIISINAEPKGNSYELTIQTGHCIELRWDNRHRFAISIPDHYKGHLCGLCGDYDGDPSNDLTIPGRGVVDAVAFGKFHTVASEGDEVCLDVVTVPDPCSQEDLRKYKDNQYCGIYDRRTGSPFVQAVLKDNDDRTKAANERRLDGLFEDCVQDHCWMQNMDVLGRCHRLETTITAIRLELNIQDRDLDTQWRSFANCQTSPETSCGGRANMVYRDSYKKFCQNTCAEPTKEVMCTDERESQGCVCEDGYMLDAALNCVPEEDCESVCRVQMGCGENVVLNNGDSIVVDPCKMKMTCQEGVAVPEELETCSEHGECSKDGLSCTCKMGYQGDGHTCTPNRSCREGYTSLGTKCYKYVRDKLDWHSAAINCGADGAQLARYDTDNDMELEHFFEVVPQLVLESQGQSRRVRCRAGRTCSVPRGLLALSARVKDRRDEEECDGHFRISEDRRQLEVDRECNARNFYVVVIDARLQDIDLSAVAAWVGGNSDVLGPNKRNGKAPFQVDPPRMVDMGVFQNSVGCFQASFNGDEVLVISPRADCRAELPSICEYDNTRQDIYDPLDFKVIPKRVNQQEAIGECEEIGRSLAVILTNAQLEKAQKLLSEAGEDGWIGLRYEGNAFKWGNGQQMMFQNFRRAPEPNRGGREYHCVSMSKRNAYWDDESCDSTFFALCGPPVDITPTQFTPYYPVKGFSSLSELKQKLQREGKQDYICQDPSVIECSAENGDGVYKSNENQLGSTITCRKDKISCTNGQELDCSTFRVRLLCPQDENQCEELVRLGATPCDGGRECFPISNHYICKCPLGSQYSEHSHSCATFCGECSVWGDPHYTTPKLNYYDFQGLCKYKLVGLCDLDQYRTSAYFEIFTKNEKCGDDVACLSEVEIQLKNIMVVRFGAEVREDFAIIYRVGDCEWSLNGVKIAQTEYLEKGVLQAVVKRSYFNLVVYSLDLSLLVSDSKLKVNIPGSYRDKMCGLCGDCGSDLFRLKNGTYLDPGMRGGRKWDRNIMALAASEYAVYDATAEEEECKVPEPKEEKDCSDATMTELAKPTMCGIFLDTTSAINSCFMQYADLDRNRMYQDCRFDACLQDEPQKAVCAMVKTFAQECLSRGTALDWRRDDFCPMKCEAGKVYRADASCEPTCGQSRVSLQTCTEEGEEGCKCPDGKMRQGDECVDPEDCGCKVYLNGDTVVLNLKIGDSMILPDCKEEVTCEVNEDDGTSELVTSDIILGPNAICSNRLPVNIECAKGYILNADGRTCDRDDVGCLQGFEVMNGAGPCVMVLPNTKIWRGAVEACNEADGTLLLIDADSKLDTVKALMDTYSSLYISGQVRAFNNGDGTVRFESVLTAAEAQRIEFANFAVHSSLLENIVLNDDVAVDDLPSGGRIFGLVARRNGDSVIIVAVSLDTPSNFVCEQRNTDDEDTKWYGPCNTDANMEDDGDQETRFDMILEPTCEVCPVPMEVRCDPNPDRAVPGSVDGTCQLAKNGLFYSCNEGEDCIDKTVSTRCAKDLDECASGHHDCPENSLCVNTVGAYLCKCNLDYPLMRDGQCQEAKTCTMSGPETDMSFIYNLNGFSNVPSLFGYDCQFKLASICEDAELMDGVPRVSVYVMSTHISGAVAPYIAGSISSTDGEITMNWAVTPETLTSGLMWFGPSNASQAELTSLSFPGRSIQSRFQFISPSTLVIRHFKNFFKITVSFAPTRIQLDFSEEYNNLMCGVCAAEPSSPGAKIVLTAQEKTELSLLPSMPCVSPGGEEEEGPASPGGEEEEEGPSTPGGPATPGEPEGPQTPEPSSCNAQYLSVCTSLNALCGYSQDTCKEDLCGGNVEICEYLATASLTACTVGLELRVFLAVQNCDTICGPNMAFRYTTQSNQPTCSEPNLLPVMSESSDADYTLACVCDEGFLLSGTDCVRPENCGCTENDRYRPAGLQWRSEDCSELYTCLGNDVIDTQSSPCGANTQCVATESGPTCECLEDFYGNPNVAAGCEEGEEDPENTKVCYTYVFSDGSSEERCECNMGFVSNCEDCEDIDECREGLHSCDLSFQTCQNVKGGYECPCRQGYHEVNGECKDVNECTQGALAGPVCEANEGCINTVGSYECKCCAGFYLDSDVDACVRDTIGFPTLPANAGCCINCNNPTLCEESYVSPKSYCYSFSDTDRKQFGSYLAMYTYFCLNQLPMNADKYVQGSCPKTPSAPGGGTAPAGPTPPPLPGSCDDASLCDALPPPPPILAQGKVCGPASEENPQTYPSYCDMVRAVCKKLGGPSSLPQDSPIMAYPGACTGTGPGSPLPELPPADPLFTPWSQFSSCQFDDPQATCGQGRQIRNRNVVPYDDDRPVREVEPFETTEDRPCFEPCPEDETNEVPGLNCPNPAFCNEVDPVCGAVGYGGARTYDSQCELNVIACLSGVRPKFLYHGECTDIDAPETHKFCDSGPILESVKYDEERDGSHCVGQVVTVGSCGNLLCEGEAGTCCQAVSFDRIVVNLQCYDSTTGQRNMDDKHIYMSATRCECVSNEVTR